MKIKSEFLYYELEKSLAKTLSMFRLESELKWSNFCWEEGWAYSIRKTRLSKVEKKLENESVESQLATPTTTTNSNSTAEVSLLVAMLVATVTFVASLD